EPGPPTTNVVRPRGKPPPVISSSPTMPVAHLVDAFAGADGSDFICSFLEKTTHHADSFRQAEDGHPPLKGSFLRTVRAVCAVARLVSCLSAELVELRLSRCEARRLGALAHRVLRCG